MIYLDNAATTKVNDDVKKIIAQELDEFWNPSANYLPAQLQKRKIQSVRRIIADYINAESPEEIIFTSGGSEANNMAIKGVIENYGIDTVITSSLEHPSVFNTCCTLPFTNNCQMILLRYSSTGVIDLEHLEEVLKRPSVKRPLVCVMMANNEIGSIQPIQQIANIVHQNDGLLHVDAVQAFSHLKIDVQQLDVDSMSVSGHKFGCPKGIGFLYKKKYLTCSPLIDGGGQEFNVRAGTENTPYIMAMGHRICTLDSIHTWTNVMKDLRSTLLTCMDQSISPICEYVINGMGDDISHLLPSIINVRFKDINARQLISLLTEYEVYVSAGSACHSGNESPSHVLLGIGCTSEEALSSIRISLGESTTRDEIYKFVGILTCCIRKLQLLQSEGLDE